jgi:hypothetical protein
MEQPKMARITKARMMTVIMAATVAGGLLTAATRLRAAARGRYSYCQP